MEDLGLEKYEELIDYLYNIDIRVHEVDLDSSQAIAIKANNKGYIAVDKKITNTTAKRFILEHEYSHFLTDAFYTVDTSRLAVKRRELKANDNMVERMRLVRPVLKALKLGLERWQVADALDIPEYVIEHCISYAKRKNINI